MRLILLALVTLAFSACAPAVPQETPAAQAPAEVAPAPTLTAKSPTAPPAQLPSVTVAQPVGPTATVSAPGDTTTSPAAEVSGADAPLKGPLSVIITSPADGAEVQTQTVTVQGEADPETVITIDDQIVLVGADRKFSVPLTLQEGPNIIEITASDPDGNQGTLYLTLTYNP